jgi:dephospho-CoA kinase
MKRIGITGGIACGKSEVVRILRGFGAKVTDADALSRQATAPGGAALPGIRAAFGLSYFDEMGRLDRRMLGDLVFRDASARKRLETIIHPIVREDMERELATFEREGANVAFLDIPLLYETSMQEMCDLVWVVAAPEALQVKRIIARDGLTEGDALARVHSQMPTQEKAALADVVLWNDGTLADLCERVEAAWRLM